MSGDARPLGNRRTSPLARIALVLLLVAYVLIEAVAGARSSPMVPVLPRGVVRPSWVRALAGWVGLRDRSATALTVVALVLVAVACAAFVAILREAWRGRAGTAVVLLCGAVAVGLAVAGPVLLSRDVTSYAAYGRMLALHRANPYAHTPAAFRTDPFSAAASREWVHTRSVYGPVFTLGSAGLAGVARRSASGTLLAFRVVAGVSAWLAALVAASVVRRVAPGREAFAAALVALDPVVVLHTVGGAHADALLALLVAGATWTVTIRTRPSPRLELGTTVLLTLAVLVKVVAVVPLAMWLVWIAARPGRGTWGALGRHVGVALAVSAAAFAPLLAGRATLSPLVGAASRQGWASPSALVARLVSPGRGAGAGGVAATMVKMAFVAGFVASVTALLARNIRRQGERASVQPAALWGGALLLLCLSIPYLLPWYAIWFLPLLVLVGDGGVVWIGVAVSVVLALTGIPAEPSVAPSAWRAMITGVHDGAAPICLGLLIALGAHLLRQRGGAMATSRSANALA
jgi:hypothetical protein